MKRHRVEDEDSVLGINTDELLTHNINVQSARKDGRIGRHNGSNDGALLVHHLPRPRFDDLRGSAPLGIGNGAFGGSMSSDALHVKYSVACNASI